MRAFVAIELDAELCDALTAAVRAMRTAQPPVKLKWVRPEQQHLTLHFFGEIDQQRVADINAALQRATLETAPFDIAPSELGCFPNIYKPNVLWVGIREPGQTLLRLHKQIAAELTRLGFETEARAFTPHLTLARVPHQVTSGARKALGEWFVRQPPPAPASQHVNAVRLMRSDVVAGGHQYTTLSTVALPGSNPDTAG